jgi:predicted ATP-grasp superfamily ATP-dependent carboligase
VQANQAVTGQEWRILRWSEIADGSVVHKAMIEAIKACRALGLTFGGVDVMISMDDKPYIAEVNTAPSVTGGMLLPNKYAAYFRKLAAGEVEELPTTNPLPINARSLFMKGLVSND